LTLVGTVAGSGKALALFNEQSTGRAVSLRVGDVYQGWRLRLIESGRATFENEGQIANYAVTERASNTTSPPLLIPTPTLAPDSAEKRDESQSRVTRRPADLPTPKTDRPVPDDDDPVADFLKRRQGR
jgi:hypothetical protein